MKVNDDQEIKELEKKVEKVFDGTDRLQLIILLKILKAINRLIQKY